MTETEAKAFVAHLHGLFAVKAANEEGKFVLLFSDLDALLARRSYRSIDEVIADARARRA